MKPIRLRALAALLVLAGCTDPTGGSTTAAPTAFEIATASLADAGAGIESIQQQLRDQPERSELLERLGWSFVERARETGDMGLYHLALASARAMDDAAVGADSADLLRGHALHALHRFPEAEAVARRLVASRGLAFDHGLLGDTLLDQGEILPAAASYQRMIDMRPGAGAYARAGRVRFLTGDVRGAVDAFALAARAVSPRQPERFAWTWSQLSRVLLHAGEIGAARATAERAAAIAPDRVDALLALARVALAEDRLEDAARSLAGAAERRPAPEVLWPWIEVLDALGRGPEARAVEARLVADGASRDARGYALWLASSGRDAERAVALASEEFAARRDPYTADVLAWARFASGDARGARAALRDALAHGTPEPRFHLHAAAVAHALGDHAAAALHRTHAERGRHLLLPSERAALGVLAGPEVSDGRSVGVARHETKPENRSRTGTGERS